MKNLTKEKAEHLMKVLKGYLKNIKDLEKLKVPDVGCGRAKRTTYVARRTNLCEGKDLYEKFFFKDIEKDIERFI